MVAALASRIFRKHRVSFSPTHLRLLHRYASTLVIAEHDGGKVKPSSLSAVAAAEAIAEGSSISLLVAGYGPSVQAAANHAATCHPSVSQVLVAETEKLMHPLAEPWAELIHSVQKNHVYSHIVMASSSFGKNVLPRAAAILDVSPVTDVIEIRASRLFVRPIYAGNALSTLCYTGSDPCMLTVRPTSFPPSSCDPRTDAAPVSHVDVSVLSDYHSKSRWLGHKSQETKRPELGSARVVVTGGRGLKNAEDFKLIEKLADKLGAAVGATRAAVDAGFVPNDLQVGQTGKIVAPDLYLAFGVSGAIQHLAGMKDSKVIVAVNKDADAPIFQVADYGLVADLFEVIPELIEKLPERK
ncbi:unnamed protein product [Victoria cruziana]